MATVRKRSLPSGLVRWQASYVDAAGKRRAKLFERRADADGWLTRVRRDLQLGTHVPESQSASIADACADYIEHCRGRMERGEHMTQKLFRLYRGLICNHILHPEMGIGALKVAKLTKSAIGDFRDRLRGAGVSVLTTRKVVGTLARILDLAISSDQLAVNHARNIIVIGTRGQGAKRVSVPPKDAVRTLMACAFDDLRTIIMVAAATGVRAGELWALRWRHLDLGSKELTVETRVDAYGDEDVTKSDAGMRTIPLSDALLTELKAWKLRSSFSKPNDLIFPNRNGGYTSHSNFLRRVWFPLFDAKGAPARFKWHNLRHFAISCWIEAGLQPKTVQTIAGHSVLAMTMDRYGHLFKSDDHRRAMDDIAGALFK
jgi:integrase